MLVRDNGVEAYDAPPRRRPRRGPLVPAPTMAEPRPNGGDLLRADDAQRSVTADFGRVAVDCVTQFGSPG